MSNENNEKFEKLEKQIGTLKFVVLIMAVALIYNSAVKTGMFGDYRITANTLAIKKIIIKGNNNENLGVLSVNEDNQVNIVLTDRKNQINIEPGNIKFLEINDSIDQVILSLPK
jgi:small nuclear ribonucleoprotein (snRNP)-like protein